MCSVISPCIWQPPVSTSVGVAGEKALAARYLAASRAFVRDSALALVVVNTRILEPPAAPWGERGWAGRAPLRKNTGGW